MRSPKTKSSSAPVMLGAFVLVLAIAAGAFLLLDQSSEPAPADTGGAVVLDGPKDEPDMPLPEAAAEPAPPERLEAAPVQPLASASVTEPLDPGAPTGAIEGRCVDEHQQPVAGALVRITRGSPLANMTFSSVRDFLPMQAVSDEGGYFSLEGVPAGKNFMLVGEQDEFATSTLQGQAVHPDQTTTDVILVMRPGAVVAGTVSTLAETPIGEARVEIYDTVADARLPPDQRRPFKIVFTDRNGRFAFTHIAMTSLKVRVSAQGYETQTLMISSALKAGPEDQDLSFRLAEGRMLAGSVVDDTGHPVEGARIEAFALKRDYQGNAVAISDAGGRFLLDGMSTEQGYQVRCTARGYSDATLPSVMVNDGEILFQLRQRMTVEGWVQTAAGTPVKEFQLALMRAIPGREPALMNDIRPFRDSEGRFSFDNLEPGSYAFEARVEGYAPSLSDSFELRVGVATPPITITVLRGGTLCGVVSDSDGKLLGQALVQLNDNNFVDTPLLKIFESMSPSGARPKRVRTNGKGRFCFNHVAPGVYQVSVKHHSSAPFVLNDVVVVDDDAGTNDELSIQMPPSAAISGLALDQNRIALPFIRVQLSQKNGYVESVTTDAAGSFQFDNLAGGSYTLTLYPDRKDDKPINPLLKLVYAQKSLREIQLRDGQQLTGVEIYLVETS